MATILPCDITRAKQLSSEIGCFIAPEIIEIITEHRELGTPIRCPSHEESITRVYTDVCVNAMIEGKKNGTFDVTTYKTSKWFLLANMLADCYSHLMEIDENGTKSDTDPRIT